jgi:hypothetical protein
MPGKKLTGENRASGSPESNRCKIAVSGCSFDVIKLKKTQRLSNYGP